MQKSTYLDSTIFSFYYDDRPGSRHRQEITVELITPEQLYMEET
jgi:hypothetical protein